MFQRSRLTLLMLAAITLCGGPARTSAETGPPQWPDQAQLRRQIEQCHLSEPPAGIPPDQARAATLDYENQCYKQLAELEHAQLNPLQDAVSRSRRHKRVDQTLLESKPLATCQWSKPPQAVADNDARLAKLEFENQCYRALAEAERDKLEGLEKAGREGVRSAAVRHRIHHHRTARAQGFTTIFQSIR
jgi:hypothetical protein